MIKRFLTLALTALFLCFSSVQANFLYPGSFNGPLYKTGASIPTAASDWLFDDASGTTITDSKGAANLSTAGVVSWSAGYLTIDGATSGNVFGASNGTYNDLNSFSIAAWVKPAAIAAAMDVVCIGTGASLTLNGYAMTLTGTNTSTLFRISDGTTGFTASPSTAMDTAAVWFLLGRYTRVGNGSSIVQLDYTKDGVTWYTASTSTANLMIQDGTFELRNKRSGTVGLNGEYHRMTLWTSVLTDAQRNLLYSQGKDAAVY